MENSKEDQILLASMEDKIDRCASQFTVTHSVFLDMRQQTLVTQFCAARKGMQYGLFGGYPDAERRVALFFPDYIAAESREQQESFLLESEEDNPMVLLRMCQGGGRRLTHRDYLGSMLGLGIKREMVGDILVRENGCDILVLKELSSFLLSYYGKAANASLQGELLPLSQLIVPDNLREEKRDTVASLRLDNVVASAFSVSRGKAASAVGGGLVFVNGLQITKADRLVKEGDKLVFRGKGKVLLKEVGGSTRKDRRVIVMDRFL